MTARTPPHCNGGMGEAFLELTLVVASEAEGRRALPEKLVVIRLMRVMTGHAHAGRNWRVRNVVLEFALVVAVEAYVTRTEHLVLVARVRVVTCRAHARSNGRVNVFRTGEPLFVVAQEAEFRRFGPEKLFVVALMRLVARRTQPGRNGRMYALLFEHRLVVAVKTHVRTQEELSLVARMRVVAARAHSHGHRRMRHLFAEEYALVVAVEAEVRRLGPEQLTPF